MLAGGRIDAGTDGTPSSAAPRSRGRRRSTRRTTGFSSKLSVNERGVPPSAGTRASRELLAKDARLPIAVEKTIWRPSGDHRGSCRARAAKRSS